MDSATATKVTLLTYTIGLVAIIYSGRSKPFQVNYRRVWGLSLLAAGAAALSDVAPKAAGPYMVLVGIVFLVSPSTGLGSLFAAAESSAQGSDVIASNGNLTVPGGNPPAQGSPPNSGQDQLRKEFPHGLPK